MPYIDPAELAVGRPRPGWEGRFFHSAHMTVAYYEIDPGADVHPHHHPNEEIWNVVEGEVEVTIGDESRVVPAGQAAIVPANVVHSVVARTPSRVIIVDHPRREVVGGFDTGTAESSPGA
ncbi:MAG TPA: cupin domain-containing protein [Candidatus Dormibacteraeota bacterium]|jgi:quercetin dioxygenase-like cupin family protein|nr:cupin domain-containing protein [Candidatus Dormibacteraeota bacterium]